MCVSSFSLKMTASNVQVVIVQWRLTLTISLSVSDVKFDVL